jgi:hypothetical protein
VKNAARAFSNARRNNRDARVCLSFQPSRYR